MLNSSDGSALELERQTECFMDETDESEGMCYLEYEVSEITAKLYVSAEPFAEQSCCFLSYEVNCYIMIYLCIFLYCISGANKELQILQERKLLQRNLS